MGKWIFKCDLIQEFEMDIYSGLSMWVLSMIALVLKSGDWG
jgi:hypothetical protein